MSDAERLLDHLAGLGHRVFRNGRCNLNLIGIRNRSRQAGRFDDWIVAVYRPEADADLQADVWPATTDPGTPYLAQPMRASGTAILVPGQYLGGFKLGSHLGKYECLVQAIPLPVWRDADRDAELDLVGEPQVGWWGIQIHGTAPGRDRVDVGKYSAGCQVLRRWDDFLAMRELAVVASRLYGERISYTLIDQPDWWRDA